MVLLSKVTDEPRFDAMGSLGIGLLLVVIAMVLASEMRSLLIGEAAHPGEVTKIRQVIEADPRVVRAAVPEARQIYLEPHTAPGAE